MKKGMRTIWKYDVPLDGREERLPPGSEVVHVGWQGPNIDVVQVWVLLDPGVTGRFRYRWRVVGTGHPAGENGEHVGTVVVRPDLVWHVMQDVVL